MERFVLPSGGALHGGPVVGLKRVAMVARPPGGECGHGDGDLGRVGWAHRG